MNVLILITGIADPKCPLARPSITNGDVLADAPLVMSPFEESALELALQLRDARPDTQLALALLGGPEREQLLRRAASYRIEQVARFDATAYPVSDLRSLARALQRIVNAQPTRPDLVLLGREFGDTDDGTVAACLAAELCWTFAARVQKLIVEDSLHLLRDAADGEERIDFQAPMLVSVTNARSNRLRHPLMKNVMAAKRIPIPATTLPGVTDCARLRIEAASSAVAQRRARACQMLGGGVSEQAAELAKLLQEWRPHG